MQLKVMMEVGVNTNWEGADYEALNTLNVNIDKYEQRQCNQLAGTVPIQCGSVGRTTRPTIYFSSHHWFSLRTCEQDRTEEIFTTAFGKTDCV